MNSSDYAPAEDFREVIKPTITRQKPLHNPNNFYERLKIAERAKEYASLHPREGQPELYTFKPNLREWYLEGLRRADEIKLPYRFA